MGRLVELRWNCQYCGTKDILGRYQACPNCGMKRDENFSAHLPDDIKSNYVPKEKEKTICRNPDWYCGYCNTFNSDSVTSCTSCGASRSESEYNYFTLRKHKRENRLNSEKESKEIKQEIKTSKKSFKPILAYSSIAIAIFFAVILTIWGIVALVTPKQVEMEVTKVSWFRSINIEKLKTVEESDWSLPNNARLKYTQDEIYTYKKIIDHYETKTREIKRERIVGYDTYYTYTDLGNGYAEEEEHEIPKYETYYETEEYKEPVYVQVPVYKTKYYYDIDKWVYERSIKTSGSDKSPYWGEFTLKSKEKEASRSENFKVEGILKEKRETDTYTISYEDWKKINVGDNIILKVPFLGTATLME